MNAFCLKKSIGLLLAVIIFSACNNDIVFNQDNTINDEGWHRTQTQEFEVEISDTIGLYDFAINLRNTEDYPYSNIYFFVKTVYPDGTIRLCDTVECYLAYPDGSWTGKGNGNIKDNRFWFTQKVSFPQKGKYVFEIQQATRDTNLIGISDIGLHISYHQDIK